MPFVLKPDVAFTFDAAFARRLGLRQVNAKEAVTVRDGQGAYFRAAVKDLGSDGGFALPYERMSRSPEAEVDVTLGCAVLARQRMHLVVQKATELGVRRIVPLLTDHSVPAAGLDHEQAHAWAGHVARAARQCRRASLPELAPPTTMGRFLSSPEFAAAELKLFLDDRTDAGPLAPAGPPKSVALLVGPEGGFSDAERAGLPGKARAWLLGGRVLRAETAVIAGLTAIHALWGDFRT